MTQISDAMGACPRCTLADRVKYKLVLINRGDPARTEVNWRVSCPCDGGLSITDLKPEFVGTGASAQFMRALYCERCGVGYVPEYMAKPLAPRYQPTPEGWRRVYLDGTLGPLLERISDDPGSGDI